MYAIKLLAIHVTCTIFAVCGRLYNSSYAALGELPYTVFLEVYNFSRCSGVIVSESWVLTAAHCLVAFRTRVPQNSIRVLAGVTNFLSYEPSDAQETFSETYFVHPNYRGAIHDIGVIKLSKPLNFSNNINKVNISPSGWPVNMGLVCSASGFGRIEYFIENSRLKKVVVDAYHGKDQCVCLHIRGAMDEMFGLRRVEYAQNIVCVLDSPTGLCVGDSGGPLVCNNTVVGVNSMLIPLTCVQSPFTCLTPNFFSTFTYLCPHLTWLAQYVPEVPPPPVSCVACCCSTLTICVFLILCTVRHLLLT